MPVVRSTIKGESMSKWKGTPEGLNSAQAAMIHRANRDEALDILEEHSFGGLSDWMDWRTRKEALLDRLREPETNQGLTLNSLSAVIMAYAPETSDERCRELLEQAQRALHSKPSKRLKDRLYVFDGDVRTLEINQAILADAIDEDRRRNATGTL
jgi:tRNA(Ile2) C34 agmatinyltransferase TiaS